MHDPYSDDPASRGACLSLLSLILGWEILAMGPPLPHCLCFLTTMGRCRNDHPTALEMTHGEYPPSLFLFLAVNTFLWVKHLFLYCAVGVLFHHFVFSVSCYLYP